MSDVTHILSRIEQGDPAASEQLLPLVYHELRQLAAAKLAHEKPGQTLQATALVHEAYLRGELSEEALREVADDATTWFQIGVKALSEGDSEKAVECFQSIVDRTTFRNPSLYPFSAAFLARLRQNKSWPDSPDNS